MSTGILESISSNYCVRFGRLAVDMKFITEMQLDEAIHLQSLERGSARGQRLLATILFDLDWMSSAQIEQVLNALAKQMREGRTVRENAPSS